VYRAVIIAALSAAVACDSAGSNTLPAVPSCLQNLVTACPLAAACTFSRSAGGAADRYCFASGATLEIMQVTFCDAAMTVPAATTVQTVRKADGSVCYTVESTCVCSMGCEQTNVTWRDAAGQAVAAEEINATGQHSVACPGAAISRVDCAQEEAPAGCASWPQIPGSPNSSTASCTEGTCP
jgi:hypothetical protein